MIEIIFDHDNDNIEVIHNGKLEFEQKLNTRSWYPSEYQKFMSEFLHLAYKATDKHITISEQNEGQRNTVEEW